MKKVLGLALALVAVIALSACGGTSASTGKSSGAASAVTPFIAKAATTGGIASVSVDSDFPSAGEIPIDASYPCATSGTVTTTGTATWSGTDASNISLAINTTTTFNTCAGDDTRCTPALNYVLGGNITGNTSLSITGGSSVSFTIKETGTVNVSGFATFDCPIDLTMTITQTEAAALASDDTPSSILNLMTGTICGKDVKDIKTLIDSSNTVYCDGVKEIAATPAS
ncbi:MAG: hypothetical protein WCQ47_00295 [bacterium]